MASDYKPNVKNPTEIHKRVLTLLEHFDQLISASQLGKKIFEEIEHDKEERLKGIGETKKRIESLIYFFKPDKKTTSVRKISFISTDPLYKKNSGRNFLVLPDEQIILSNIDNIDNQDHEFLHGIINPIVEKLSKLLMDEQKEKISQLANKKLKQDYGSGYFNLLCEELIRTYNDVFKKGERPQTYEDFVIKISEITDDQFKNNLVDDKGFREKCDLLEIKTVDYLKSKSREYFEKFEENKLREIIFDIYKEYVNRAETEYKNFEQFILSRFPTVI